MAALAVAFVHPSRAGVLTVRQLSDVHVGRSKPELLAQRRHSSDVIRFFTVGHRWMLAARHRSCRVPWGLTCTRARAQLRAHRWLRQVAVARLEQFFPVDPWEEFSCIHRYEGATDSNTGNGYYGGLQMDLAFQRAYGPSFLARWGTADRWPIWAQVAAARRARDSGRGYGPWPNTARACGLL